MEEEVLNGAHEVLRRYRPAILLETSMEFEAIRKRQTRKQVLSTLAELGYDVFDFSHSALRPIRYPDLPQNCLALPK